MILHHGTLTDFVGTRFDEYGPWVLLSATKEGVTARRPRAGTKWFTWREWWEMPAHEENSLQAALTRPDQSTETDR
jgi:hypothetical protein